ncbi:MAG: hypothetical protein RR128_08735 [Clostridium sp.]
MKKKLKTLIVIATLGIGLVIASQQIEFTIGARENNFNHDGKVLWSSWGVEPNFDYIAYSKGTKEN